MHLAGTILPIFAIILTGWLAGASGYLPRALAAPLMRFAYFVAMRSLSKSLISQCAGVWRFRCSFN
jgi:malonate transporter